MLIKGLIINHEVRFTKNRNKLILAFLIKYNIGIFPILKRFWRKFQHSGNKTFLLGNYWRYPILYCTRSSNSPLGLISTWNTKRNITIWKNSHFAMFSYGKDFWEQIWFTSFLEIEWDFTYQFSISSANWLKLNKFFYWLNFYLEKNLSCHCCLVFYSRGWWWLRFNFGI